MLPYGFTRPQWVNLFSLSLLDGTAATEATTGTTHPTAESTDGVDSSHRHRTISHSSAAKANLASSINSQYTNTQTLTDSESDSDPEADSPRSKEESFDFYPSSRPKVGKNRQKAGNVEPMLTKKQGAISI